MTSRKKTSFEMHHLHKFPKEFWNPAVASSRDQPHLSTGRNCTWVPSSHRFTHFKLPEWIFPSSRIKIWYKNSSLSSSLNVVTYPQSPEQVALVKWKQITDWQTALPLLPSLPWKTIKSKCSSQPRGMELSACLIFRESSSKKRCVVCFECYRTFGPTNA